jgi:hypothetical protein
VADDDDTTAALLEVVWRRLFGVAIDVVALISTLPAGDRRPPLLFVAGALWTCVGKLEEHLFQAQPPTVDAAERRAWTCARHERLAEFVAGALKIAGQHEAVSPELLSAARSELGQLLAFLCPAEEATT